MRKKVILIAVLLLALCLLALLIWYYRPIHISGTFVLTNWDTMEEKNCTVDLTLRRRILRRAAISGTFYLDEQLYTVVAGENDTKRTGLGEYIRSLDGYFMAYHYLAREGPVGTAWPITSEEFVYLRFCISGWRNSVKKFAILDGDGNLWGNCPLGELLF